ncbi:MAG: tetratricopeptide repeat protein, partial [Pyrinomonadaceae bacterium]
MSFDKTKALRNAERFLAQGKIRAAIGEYKQMVANDPKDFGTLNILGDLYVKNSEKDEAVKCFKKVAEYYAKQGFSQKAIAVYNKLSKLEPKSVETSERLAELYKTKGSPLEARSHYLTLARHYQSKGRPIEALAIWKQVALIEPDNMEVFLTIAQSYIDEKAFDEAIQAFIDGATRFNAKGDYQSAESTLERAFAINARDSRAWAAFAECKSSQGKIGEAIDRIRDLLSAHPHDRDLLEAITDCQLIAENLVEAEKSVIKLV